MRTSATEKSGFTFLGCKLTGSGSTFLGRPWGAYSRVVFAYSFFSNVVAPQGWNQWGDSTKEKYFLTFWFVVNVLMNIFDWCILILTKFVQYCILWWIQMLWSRSRQGTKSRMVKTVIGWRSYRLLEQGLYRRQRLAPTCPFSLQECSQTNPK